MKTKLFRKNMTKSEQLIAEYLISNQKNVSQMTINQVADACCVSKSMVTKFANNSGFDGFKSLKYCLANNISDSNVDYSNFYEKDNILDFYEHFSEEKVNNLIDIFEQSDKVIFVGFGPSLGVGKYFLTRFRFSFFKNFVVENDEAVLEIETKSKEKIAIVYITASGNTETIDSFIDKFMMYDVTTIVVSESYVPKYEYLGLNYINFLPSLNEHNYVDIRSRTLYFIYFEEIIRRKLLKNRRKNEASNN